MNLRLESVWTHIMSNDELDYLKWRVDQLEGDLERANRRLAKNSKFLEITRSILEPLPDSEDAIVLLDQSHQELQDEIVRLKKELFDAEATYKKAVDADRRIAP